MFEVYEVEAWLVVLPWVLFGVAAIVLIVAWRGWKKWQLAIDRNTREWEQEINKAKANAREAEAGHRECARKLEAEQVESAKWRSLALAYGERMPKRRKDGKFAPKSGKTGERKKF